MKRQETSLESEPPVKPEPEDFSAEVAEIFSQQTHLISEETVVGEEIKRGELTPESLSEELLATEGDDLTSPPPATDDALLEELEDELPAISEFSESNLNFDVLQAIAALGWQTPTTVQGMCLPHTLRGRDVAGFAQTGTGKTGVFLITIAQRLRATEAARPSGETKSTSPQAIVIVPTRELAIQIMEEAEKLFAPLALTTLAVYGGMEWEEQAAKLQKGVDLMVATCGRLKDYYEKKFFSFAETKIFVCDEVDRMFDMGFVTDVEVFLEQLPNTCQRLFFSATSNEKVKELSFEYLTRPIYISAQTDELTPANIEQHALLCETPDKLKVLLGLFTEHKPERAIIFTNTKLTATWLQYKLRGNGIQVDLITGDLPQAKRIQLIRRIKNGEIKALIATDVASRGLHISDVSHVYNFDLPDEPSNYVHRIGRTARAGAAGKSYSLVCEEYGANFLAIQELLGKDAPQSTWYDPTYLAIEDQADNPFENNFGKGIERRQPPVAQGQRFGRDQAQPQRFGRDKGPERHYERSATQGRGRDGGDRHRQHHRRNERDRFDQRGRREGRRPAAPTKVAAPTLVQILKRMVSLVFFWRKKKPR